jgi:hypothetical protein
MKRQLSTLLILLVSIAIRSYAQTEISKEQIQSNVQNSQVVKSFEISAAAHGFKCPFLTPKYIQRIHNLDSCTIWKGDDLVIHVEFTKQTNVNEEQLLFAAERTGYEKKNITVKEIVKQ